MHTGLTNNIEILVSEDKTALSMGSGTLRVFATPAMIALMEKTAAECVAPHLEDGFTSVGTLLNVKHVSATPVGKVVRCTAVLTEIDGRRLVFDVQAFDDAGLIGNGTHERFIVNSEKFIAKCDTKYEK